MEVRKPLVDVVDQWKPYVPTWYHDPGASPSATPSESATAIFTPKSPGYHPTTGVIAGIAVSVFAVIGLLSMCGCVAWRNHKKAKQKDREKAQLADAMNPNGVTRRIDELMYGPPSHESLSTTAVTKSSPVQPQSEPQYDVYGNHLPRVSEKHYRPTSPQTQYNPTNPDDHYNNTTANEEHYVPAAIRREPRSRDILSTTAVSPSFKPYEAYKPSSPDPGLGRRGSAYDYGIGRRPSRRSDSRMSEDSMGTTAVTASPVQRYSIEAHQPQAMYDARRQGRPSYDEYGQKITYR